METGAVRVQPRNLIQGNFSEGGKKVPFQSYSKADVTRSRGFTWCATAEGAANTALEDAC